MRFTTLNYDLIHWWWKDNSRFLSHQPDTGNQWIWTCIDYHPCIRSEPINQVYQFTPCISWSIKKQSSSNYQLLSTCTAGQYFKFTELKEPPLYNPTDVHCTGKVSKQKGYISCARSLIDLRYKFKSKVYKNFTFSVQFPLNWQVWVLILWEANNTVL